MHYKTVDNKNTPYVSLKETGVGYRKKTYYANKIYV